MRMFDDSDAAKPSKAAAQHPPIDISDGSEDSGSSEDEGASGSVEEVFEAPRSETCYLGAVSVG